MQFLKRSIDYLYVSMRDLKREVFKVMFLNTKNKIEAVENVFYGSLTSSSVYPRELCKMALEKNAASVIFVHNHPSGAVEPSDSDKHITKTLVAAAE